ncbi:hypothetical protein BN59_02848 [Legionella massiliensis]|uniref:Uncharacterized protein n=1 Tax=Legionella massiliensis TaxID=1034943 RepID=A0A078L3L8_9GAMM|nr:hypothetical protein [Legionella massiliensis]CDZ78538.1 hypothetical protein BN59_02848 [Legionella massiliensis]CEE14276.1 hypothetical protein BN1094_02848 [Legionella massiliensis]
MKKIIFFVLLALGSQIYASDASYLFFQSASQASLTKLDKNNYRLTLEESPRYINYFTDRPIRKSGIFSLSKFFSLWSNKKIKNNFTDSPPNVALSMVSKDRKRHNFIAIVSKPVYKEGIVSYQIHPLNNYSLQPDQFKYVMLFFDDIHWNPGGF